MSRARARARARCRRPGTRAVPHFGEQKRGWTTAGSAPCASLRPWSRRLAQSLGHGNGHGHGRETTIRLSRFFHGFSAAPGRQTGRSYLCAARRPCPCLRPCPFPAGPEPACNMGVAGENRTTTGSGSCVTRHITAGPPTHDSHETAAPQRPRSRGLWTRRCQFHLGMIGWYTAREKLTHYRRVSPIPCASPASALSSPCLKSRCMATA